MNISSARHSESPMERRTLAESFRGTCRRFINHGGKGYWCAFDYTGSPAPECEAVEVRQSAPSDADTAKWFPHIQRGMLRGRETVRERGCDLVGIRVEVHKIH